MSASFQLFNLDTMSGVFPGTRTMVFQRVRVRLHAASDAPAAPAAWARLLWYDDPAACVVELNDTPLLRIPNPQGKDFGIRLQAGLAAAGYELLACGSCTFWQASAAVTHAGLTLGRCTWQDATGAQASLPSSAAGEGTGGDACVPVAPDVLALQSLLALDCSHWQLAQEPAAAPLPADPSQAGATPPTIPMRAERESDERWSWWGRLRRSWRGRPRSVETPAPVRWEDKIVERSGLGAGTEPCFACQGRIANLGALAVASPEGDKQTFSVWRCRLCCTYYLNDWIDRWERTDSLETEETYYRLAPYEALAILAVIDNVVDADHPARRHERGAQRAWMQQFLNGRPVLSHQIKQGR
jgi:hypothetical protein